MKSSLNPSILAVLLGVVCSAELHAQTNWFVRRGGGTPYHLGGVAYGVLNNGSPAFVAVSGPAINDGILTPFALTSPDGINWTEHEIDGTAPAVFNSVAFQNGRFVAVGWNSAGAVVAHSDDGGGTWTRQSSVFGGVLNDVAPGYNGAWVAVGGIGSPGAIANGAVLTSPTGAGDWTLATLGVAVELHGVVQAGDKTIAVGSQGFMFESENGGSWQQLPAIVAESLHDITYRQHAGSSTIVAVGQNGRILRSSDFGANWSIRPPATATLLYDIAWNQDVMIGVGFGGIFVYSHDDGVNWTQQGPTFPADNFYGATYGIDATGQGRFVAVGTLERILTVDVANPPQAPNVTLTINPAHTNWAWPGGTGQINLNNPGTTTATVPISSTTSWITILNPTVQVPAGGVTGAPFRVLTNYSGAARIGFINVLAGSNRVVAVTQSGGPPARPTILENQVGPTQITGIWNPVPGADGYRVERQTGPVSWTAAATLPANQTAYTANNLSAWAEYFFRVIAFNENGESPASVSFGGRTPPAPPEGFDGQAENWSQILITWNDVDGAAEYYLDRKEGTNDWIALAIFQPGEQAYLDVGLTPDTDYSYRMRSRGEPPDTQFSSFTPELTARTAPYTGQIYWGTATTVSLPFDRGGQPDLNDVAFGNGRYMAVGNDGEVLSSPDGLTWTPEVSSVTVALQDVAFGSGLFVAVAGTGEILTSPGDGVWTPRASGRTNLLTGLAYGNGQFVLIASTNEVLISADGITWTPETIDFDSATSYIAFGNGEFLVAGAGGSIRNSTNGIQWTQTRAGNDADLFAARISFAWNGSVWVAGGIFGRFSTSPDGQTWTDHTNTFLATFTDLAVQGGTFVAVSSGAFAYNGFLRSTNGLDWEQRGTAPGPVAISAGTSFAAVGVGGYIAHSPDGITWTDQRPSILQQPLPQLNGIDGANGVVVVAGSRNISASTNDGIFWYRNPVSGTWSNLSAILPPTAALSSVRHINGEFFVTGSDGQDALVLRSPDGLNWTQTVVPQAEAFLDIAYGEGRFIASGIERLFQSINGTLWTEEGITNGFFPSANYRSLLFVDGRFYVRGLNSFEGLRASEDGLDWNILLDVVGGFNIPQVDAIAHGRAFGRKMYLAFAQGVIGPGSYVSADGIRWAPRIPGVWASSAGYGNGVFVGESATSLMASLMV